MPTRRSRKPTRLLIRVLVAFTAVFILSLGAYYWYAKRKQHGDLKGIELNYSKYPVRGIDVSHFTGKVDFEKIAGQKIQFAYIRATYGEHKVDNRFVENHNNAKAAGIPVGAYHYLRFEQDGLKQARHFLKHAGNKDFELLHVLDVEDWGNHFLSSRKKVIRDIRAFISEVEAKTGRPVMIYTNENGYRKYIEKDFSNQPLWICSFNNPPGISGQWVFWQHSHVGKMYGAEGWVDYNVFNGDKKAWRRYLRSLKKHSP
jgi:lysozyme